MDFLVCTEKENRCCRRDIRDDVLSVKKTCGNNGSVNTKSKNMENFSAENKDL